MKTRTSKTSRSSDRRHRRGSGALLVAGAVLAVAGGTASAGTLPTTTPSITAATPTIPTLTSPTGLPTAPITTTVAATQTAPEISAPLSTSAAGPTSDGIRAKAASQPAVVPKLTTIAAPQGINPPPAPIIPAVLATECGGIDTPSCYLEADEQLVDNDLSAVEANVDQYYNYLLQTAGLDCSVTNVAGVCVPTPNSVLRELGPVEDELSQLDADAQAVVQDVTGAGGGVVSTAEGTLQQAIQTVDETLGDLPDELESDARHAVNDAESELRTAEAEEECISEQPSNPDTGAGDPLGLGVCGDVGTAVSAVDGAAGIDASGVITTAASSVAGASAGPVAAAAGAAAPVVSSGVGTASGTSTSAISSVGQAVPDPGFAPVSSAGATFTAASQTALSAAYPSIFSVESTTTQASFMVTDALNAEEPTFWTLDPITGIPSTAVQDLLDADGSAIESVTDPVLSAGDAVQDAVAGVPIINDLESAAGPSASVVTDAAKQVALGAACTDPNAAPGTSGYPYFDGALRENVTTYGASAAITRYNPRVGVAGASADWVGYGNPTASNSELAQDGWAKESGWGDGLRPYYFYEFGNSKEFFGPVRGPAVPNPTSATPTDSFNTFDDNGTTLFLYDGHNMFSHKLDWTASNDQWVGEQACLGDQIGGDVNTPVAFFYVASDNADGSQQFINPINNQYAAQQGTIPSPEGANAYASYGFSIWDKRANKEA